MGPTRIHFAYLRSSCPIFLCSGDMAKSRVKSSMVLSAFNSDDECGSGSDDASTGSEIDSDDHLGSLDSSDVEIEIPDSPTSYIKTKKHSKVLFIFKIPLFSSERLE